MIGRHFLVGFTLLLAALVTSACTSRDDKAAGFAAAADNALQQGNLPMASELIRRALLARDDVGDYWLLSGRIALAQGSYSTAYDAYENALTLDRSNLEALVRLCQLAVVGGRADRAERYADELNALQPGDPAALNVKAALAFTHGDSAKAEELIGQILRAQPSDPTALITRSRMLSADGDYAAAARAVEASLAAAGDPVGRLQVLEEAYLKGGNVDGYRQSVARMARAAPKSPSALINYARSLYNQGNVSAAFAASRQALAVGPGDVANGEAVLRLWLAQPTAMPVDSIVNAAVNGAPETRAALATYANTRNRPDLALAALGDLGASGPPSTAVNDAKIARAEAMGLLDHRDVANAIIAAVLDADPDQPRALALRGKVRAAAGDRVGAIEDLRHALASSPGNADARLALANLQLTGDDGVLAIETLRDGLRDPGADPRLAVRLAKILRQHGQTADADGALAEYRRSNPFTPLPDR